MADLGTAYRSPSKAEPSQRDATSDDFRIVPIYWLGFDGELPMHFGSGGGGGPTLPEWGQLFPL